MLNFNEIELEVVAMTMTGAKTVLITYRTSMIPQQKDVFIFKGVKHAVSKTIWDIDNKKATIIVSG